MIVTADHAHSSQIVAADAKAPGLTQTLTTKDGAPMTLSYGNSEEESQGTPAPSCASRPMARTPPTWWG